MPCPSHLIKMEEVMGNHPGLLGGSKEPAIFQRTTYQQVRKVVLRLLKLLLPSFVVSPIKGRTTASRDTYSTSPLQGLRGVAAMIVFHRHVLMSFSEFPDYGFGARSTPEIYANSRWLHQLPIFRVVYSGGAMVEIFFVISGYTQSSKVLRLMQQRRFQQAHMSLVSSLFRRPIRLYLPSFISSVLIAIAIWLGLYEWDLSLRQTWFEISPSQLARQPTLSRQLLTTWRSYRNLINPFDWDEYSPSVNPHLWTIPLEVRASLALHLTLFAVSMLKKQARIAILLSVMILSHLCWRWECVLFLAGALIAEVNLLRLTNLGEEEIPLPVIRPSRAYLPSKRLSQGMYMLSLVIAMFLLGFPKKDTLDTFGYQTLTLATPKQWLPFRFWNGLGAVIIVWAITNDTKLSHLFEGPIAQYLGKISYSIYLVHGAVLHSVGFVVVPLVWRWTGRQTVSACVSGFELALIFVILPVLLWTADVFWRLVDIPCGNLTFWIKSSLFVT